MKQINKTASHLNKNTFILTNLIFFKLYIYLFLKSLFLEYILFIKLKNFFLPNHITL